MSPYHACVIGSTPPRCRPMKCSTSMPHVHLSRSPRHRRPTHRDTAPCGWCWAAGTRHTPHPRHRSARPPRPAPQPLPPLLHPHPCLDYRWPRGPLELSGWAGMGHGPGRASPPGTLQPGPLSGRMMTHQGCGRPWKRQALAHPPRRLRAEWQ